MKHLAIRLSGQKTPTKSQLICVKSLFQVLRNYQQPTITELKNTLHQLGKINFGWQTRMEAPLSRHHLQLSVAYPCELQ
jgi:hypothetical protein